MIATICYATSVLILSLYQIWADYDEEAEKAAEIPADDQPGALKPEYLDVIVSDVRTKNGFSFSVQILNTEGTSVFLSIVELIERYASRHCFAGTADARLLHPSSSGNFCTGFCA